jgi:hypothetical protein
VVWILPIEEINDHLTRGTSGIENFQLQPLVAVGPAARAIIECALPVEDLSRRLSGPRRPSAHQHEENGSCCPCRHAGKCYSPSLSVMLSHMRFYVDRIGGNPDSVFRYFDRRYSYGAWFFFVLSGFLMAYLVAGWYGGRLDVALHGYVKGLVSGERHR